MACPRTATNHDRAIRAGARRAKSCCKLQAALPMSFRYKNMLSSNAPSPYGEAAHSFSPSLQAEAQRICQSEQNFAVVKDTIRLFPPEFTKAVELLSKRPKPWLHEFRRGIFEIDHPVHQRSGEAHDIVDAIRERQPTHPLNGDWIVQALQRQTPVHEIATTIDVEICNTLRTVSFSDTVAMYLSYSGFLQQITLAAVRVRNQLASFHEAANGLSALHSLSKMLPDHQLLGQWIVSSAIEVNSSSSISVLMRSFTRPIEEQFIQHGNNFKLLTQRLLLYESFFNSQITFPDDLNWNALFAIDPSLRKRIKEPPELLARSKTLAVRDLFRAVTLPDYISNTGRAKDIGREWSKFYSDIKACLCIPKMTPHIMGLAECLLLLGNIHSATAIGLALWNSNPRPTTSWWAWIYINPQDNFAGSENYGRCCLPYMNRRFMALQKAQSSEEGLRRFFDFLPSLWAELEPKEKSEQKETERSAREWSLTIAEFCR
ncbi:hypothetical protein NA56DRAFT_94707 [Hyaloscypha hepaticicola]|uniref:Uncharacterized protein n=1 Tax=Hyaloscypha hepaticicola TaxID=2082293 RepID=A0A2J6Q8T4_9HELO|nr:hypothetical protein NA56DRAFT_94707 [Hyaloscypha hepaticicola]